MQVVDWGAYGTKTTQPFIPHYTQNTNSLELLTKIVVQKNSAIHTITQELPMDKTLNSGAGNYQPSIPQHTHLTKCKS